MSSSTGGGAMCPAMEPMNQDACPEFGLNCDFGMDQCTCRFNGWRCGPCPDTEPMDGGMCMSTGGMGGSNLCEYGANQCSCIQNQWNCATCPMAAPMDGDNCADPGLICNFGAAGSCGCFGGQWNCQAACPSMQPNPGDMCALDQNQQCNYGMTTCVCINDQFFCN